MTAAVALAAQRHWWAILLIVVGVFCVLPGFALRLMLLAYPDDDPRKAELRGAFARTPIFRRLFWVFAQLELCCFEGLPTRISQRRDRRTEAMARDALDDRAEEPEEAFVPLMEELWLNPDSSEIDAVATTETVAIIVAGKPEQMTVKQAQRYRENVRELEEGYENRVRELAHERQQSGLLVTPVFGGVSLSGVSNLSASAKAANGLAVAADANVTAMTSDVWNISYRASGTTMTLDNFSGVWRWDQAANFSKSEQPSRGHSLGRPGPASGERRHILPGH